MKMIVETGRRTPLAHRLRRPSYPAPEIDAGSCFVLLGRMGDIVNALPILYHFAQQNQCPVPLVVARRYASLLEGCNYVVPEIWAGDFWGTISEAIAWAKERYASVVNLQTGGKDFVYDIKATSFNLEAWAVTGLLEKRRDIPLVFDNRNAVREAKLIERAREGSMLPLLLYNMAGISSPFPHSGLLYDEMAKWAHLMKLVNTTPLKAERFYDLVGLFDQSAGLITIDTATLHLAAASTMPFVALIEDRKTPWYGSEPKGRCILKLGYSKVPSDMMTIHAAISRMYCAGRVTHLYPTHHATGRTAERNAMAKATWNRQGWAELGLSEDDTQRYISDSEKRRLPFVKDMIDRACKDKPDSHIIALTNSDTCMGLDAMPRCLMRLVGVDACYSLRTDFDRVDRFLSPDEVKAGEKYPGSDLYVFRVGWWRKHRAAMPDMLIGAEAWDLCLRVVMDETHAGVPIGFNDLIYHEKHFSPVYNDAKGRTQLPTQRYNRMLGRRFCIAHGIDPRKHGL